MSELIIRGLPYSIARDAMWMTEDTDIISAEMSETSRHGATEVVPIFVAMLAVLVFLADLLFWKHPVGLSLIVFSAAVSTAAIINLRPKASRREWAGLAALWVGFALPAFELLQLVSVIILIVGHLGVLIWCATRSSARGLFHNMLRMPYLMTEFVVVRITEMFQKLRRENLFQMRREAASAWVLPFGVGSIFILLFLGANPIFEQWADSLSQVELKPSGGLRLLFWVAIAGLVLPFVLFKLLAKQFATTPLPEKTWRKPDGVLVNARSITNSLLAFNLMFLFQNITDMAFLWGGADLPVGMTYATYAHQGAYPLMLTSILAGVFALVSRRYVSGSRLLKGLLLLWVLQNVFLVGSALARLDLYVEAYGLTYLRLRAAIGMGLVLVGMVLLLWQVWRGKSNIWLTGVFAGLFAATLYVGCFVNFGYVIARTNLAQEGHRFDVDYLCENFLGGVKAIADHAASAGNVYCAYQLELRPLKAEGWRDWSFRSSRLGLAQQYYLAGLPGKNWTLLRDSDDATQYDYDQGGRSDEARHSDR